jgi:hypothetical protein
MYTTNAYAWQYVMGITKDVLSLAVQRHVSAAHCRFATSRSEVHFKLARCGLGAASSMYVVHASRHPGLRRREWGLGMVDGNEDDPFQIATGVGRSALLVYIRSREHLKDVFR